MKFIALWFTTTSLPPRNRQQASPTEILPGLSHKFHQKPFSHRQRACYIGFAGARPCKGTAKPIRISQRPHDLALRPRLVRFRYHIKTAPATSNPDLRLAKHVHRRTRHCARSRHRRSSRSHYAGHLYHCYGLRLPRIRFQDPFQHLHLGTADITFPPNNHDVLRSHRRYIRLPHISSYASLATP